MKRFHYPLEAVLRLKRQLKLQAQQAQQVAGRAVDAAREQVRQCERQLQSVTADLNQRLGVLVPAGEYLGRQDVVHAIQREIRDAQRQLAQAEQVWQQTRERFSQLAIQVESLENHRSGKWREYLRECRVAAHNQMDDFVLRQWSEASPVPQEVTDDV